MKIAVIGAGLSGLACAWRLVAQGHTVTVYERARLGGRMSTVRVDGFGIDTGANLLLGNYDRLKALADEVGIGDQWFEFHSGSGGILEGGSLDGSPTSLGDVLGLRGLPLASRLRLLVFLAKSWRQAEHLDFFDLSQGDDDEDDEDAWAATVDRYGKEVAEHLVDPFVRTFHFHSSRRLSMKYFDALAGLLVRRGGFTTHGFRGYMEALPNALAARLNVVMAEVEQVRPGKGEVIVTVQGAAHTFDRVVIATTASGARKLLAEPTAAQATLLERVQYSSTMMVSFRVGKAAAGDFEGIWVPFSQSSLVAACANESCKGSVDDDACVLTLGLHEEAARELMPLADQRIFHLVAHEWERLWPECRGEMEGLNVARWPEALPIYGPGDLSRVKAFWAHGQGDKGIWLCGDYLNHPWLEGAVRCGEKVAEQVNGWP